MKYCVEFNFNSGALEHIGYGLCLKGTQVMLELPLAARLEAQGAAVIVKHTTESRAAVAEARVGTSHHRRTQ
jgi:hypothetical protein